MTSREDALQAPRSGEVAQVGGDVASVAQRGAQGRGGGLKVLRGALRAMLGLNE